MIVYYAKLGCFALLKGRIYPLFRAFWHTFCLGMSMHLVMKNKIQLLLLLTGAMFFVIPSVMAREKHVVSDALCGCGYVRDGRYSGAAL